MISKFRYLMKGTFLFIITFCLIQDIYSQGFINSNKSKAKKYLLKHIEKEKINNIITETDTSITFLIRDTSVQNLDLILKFDAQGKCYEELRTLSCDSCYDKILTQTLNEKIWGWEKIDSKTYFSKFSKRLSLSLQEGNARSFIIRRIFLSRKKYKERLFQK